MNFIYVSTLCSSKMLSYFFTELKEKPQQQAQKYHRLLAHGLASNENIKVYTVSSLPVTHKNCGKRIIKSSRDIEGNVYYKHLTTLNIPLCRNLLIFIQSFFEILKLSFNKDKKAIICDILSASVTAGAMLAAKICGIKTIAIVTDVPSIAAKKRSRFMSSINNYLLKRASSYIFLTEQMNKLLNNKNKPYLVMEGHADINMANIPNELTKKNKTRICIYAGSLRKIYGIDCLVNAFIKANVKNSELHLYGMGDYAKELEQICSKHPNIRYFGVVPNDVIVQNQIRATLLINPRPTGEEYTKYSFPSKNMEYMASGTPVLTTKLPGMPKEYEDYVYIIENESTEGITQKLCELLQKSPEELHLKGSVAKKFVLEHKNNIVQANKVIDLAQGITNENRH
jgi:glycosyltransferase involved in cell wall biosynthesis